MSATSRLVECWLDYGSPYAYILADRLEGVLSRHDVTVAWKAIVLARLPHYGGYGPHGELKQRYVMQDVTRSAAYHGVTIHMPKPFPVQSELAARVALIADEACLGTAYHHGVLRAVWADSLDIGDPAVLTQVVREAGGDGDEIVARGQTPGTADRLTTLIAEADSRGIFGVPTLTLGDELFWGNDRLDQLVRRLAAPDAPTRMGFT